MPAELIGNAYESASARVPSSLGEAARMLAESKVALHAFGQPVIDHYLNAARVELDAYNSAVTDWERIRGFERL
jgi:glutamine synthetase